MAATFQRLTTLLVYAANLANNSSNCKFLYTIIKKIEIKKALKKHRPLEEET